MDNRQQTTDLKKDVISTHSEASKERNPFDSQAHSGQVLQINEADSKSKISRLPIRATSGWLEMTIKNLFRVSKYTGKKQADREIDATVLALKKKTREIEELDQKIIRLQQSGKTTFRSMNRIHVYLSMRNKAYHKLHTLHYASHFNTGALAIFLLSFGFAITSNFTTWMGPTINRHYAAVTSIEASSPEDPSLYQGEGQTIAAGFSNKEIKSVGATVVSKSDRIPNANNYQLSMNLLSDGLNIPAEKTLGTEKQVSLYRSPDFSLSNTQAKACTPDTRAQALACFIHTKVWSTVSRSSDFSLPKQAKAWPTTTSTAKAEDVVQTTTLPASTITNAEVKPLDKTVLYEITDKINARYQVEETKIKETIVIKDKDAIQGNTVSFSLNSSGLIFLPDASNDGSYQAYREEDQDKVKDPDKRKDTIAVFRLYKPTIEDKNHKQGKIEMSIEGNLVRYTIAPDFLVAATYPIFIDPTISPSGATRTWDGGGADANWATPANWSADTAPVAGDAVVINQVTTPNLNDTINAASDSVADDLYSITVDGANWGANSGFLIRTSVVDTTNHFLYYGTGDSPAKIIKVNTTNNKVVGVLTLNSNEANIGAYSLIDVAGDAAYFTTGTSPYKVVKIRLSTFTEVSTLTLSGIGCAYAGVIDTTPGQGYAYFAGDTTPSKIAKIRLSDFTQVDTLTLQSGENVPKSATFDPTTGLAYFGAYTAPAKIVKVNLWAANFGQNGWVAEMTLNTNQNYPADAEIDPTNGFAYFYTYSGTYDVVKINIAPGNFSEVSSFSTGGGGKTMAIDLTNHYIYAANTGGGTSLIRVDLNNFPAGSTTLNTGLTPYAYAVDLDATAGYIYMGGGSGAGAVGKSDAISLASFTKSSTVIMGQPVLTLKKHAIVSNDGSPNNYKWDLQTLTVNSGEVVVEGDTTVNPVNDDGTTVNPLPTGCDTTVKCGMGMIINANDITVAAGAKISADGKGFAVLAGPGKPSSNGGGSYGGLGVAQTGTVGPTYDSIASPKSLGSGGRYAQSTEGTSGGGAIRLVTSGTLQNDGSITANGLGGYYGGASGGTISISTGTLGGNGSINANGGNGSINSGGFGGGGGGRIAITAASNTFGGTTTAYGGTGSSGSSGGYSGAAGTVYKNIASTQSLIVQNNSYAPNISATTKVTAGDTIPANVTIQAKGNMEISSGVTFDLGNSSLTLDGTGTITHSGGTLTTGSSYTLANLTLKEGNAQISSNLTDLTIGNGGILEQTSANTTIGGLANLTINSGGTITHTGNENAVTATPEDQLIKLNLSVTNLTIDSGGIITADGKGYTKQQGPGAVGSSCGGTYGGVGGKYNGASTAATYGSITQPTDLGSGGTDSSSSGAGGGAIKLNISGAFANSGSISAAGGNGTYAGGSGGSVYITVGGDYSGAASGLIATNGGQATSSSYPGGGGGRISVSANTISYSGQYTSFPNASTTGQRAYSAAGTIFTKTSSQTNGSLLIDNNSITSYAVDSNGNRLGMIRTKLPSGSYTFDTITLNRLADLEVSTGTTLNITSTTITGDGTGTLTHSGTGALVTNSAMTIGSWKLAEHTSAIGTVTDLTINSGGVLTHGINGSTETNKLDITLTNLTINSGGSVNVTGKGYATTFGPGTGSGLYRSAGHGGAGAANSGVAGTTYGSQANPTNIGSGGSDSAGGGSIKLQVTGTLNNIGGIVADASNGTYGAGSGGSIYLIVGTFFGTGPITAKGGNALTNYSTGGGGRIAVYIKSSPAAFPVTPSVAAGTNGVSNNLGSVGTVYTQHLPQMSVTSPSNGSTNISQNPAITFTGSDAESDYWLAKVSVSTDNFSTSCDFIQSITTSSFNAGTCAGAYSSLAGSFSGLNYDANGDGTNDSYKSTYPATSTGTFTISSDLTQNQNYQVRVYGADPKGAAIFLAAKTGGLSFNGSSNFVKATTNQFNSQTATVSTWVRTTQTTDAEFVDYSNSMAYYGWKLYMSGGKPKLLQVS